MKNDIRLGVVCRHIKSGHTYVPVELIKIKIENTGWENGVLYQENLPDGRRFACTVEAFKNRFENIDPAPMEKSE